WNWQNVVDAACVLCRQRRQHRRAVDTECRECLEVGLNAGAAGAVRPGDGQCNRRWLRLLVGHSVPVRAPRPPPDDSKRIKAMLLAWPSTCVAAQFPRLCFMMSICRLSGVNCSSI